MEKSGDFKSNKQCSVPQCKSRRTDEISLFAFPKEEALKKRWVDATKIDKPATQFLQVCSRHFIKSDYILADYANTTKVRRLKRTAVPSQNLPWQFPNKRVSPTLAKARMERLQKRTQQKTSTSPSKKEKIKEQDDLEHSSGNGDAEAEKSIKKIEDSPSEDKPEQKVETDDIKNKDKIVQKRNIVAEKTDDKMRSRAPTRLRQRKGVLKCELCGRKCLTPQALRTHQQIAHKNAKNDQIYTQKKETAMNKAKKTLKRASMPQITVKQPEKITETKPAIKANKSLNDSDLVAKVLEDFESDGMSTDTDTSSDESKKKESLKPEKKGTRCTEFECPRCKRRFAVYFSALRHIQKHHSGLKKGEKVPTNLPTTVKPNRIETCTICKAMLKSDIHLCLGPQKLSQGLVCAGCNQDFRTLALFDQHKSGMHSNGVESMFFPSFDEFEDWKQKMEMQTKVQYTVLDQNDTKQVHRCAAPHAATVTERPAFCPSSLIVQEFTKGFQVHYYPDHFGHSYEPYNLSSDFKKYSIASLMSLTANRLPDDSEEEETEPDLYIQFKKVTDLLVNEAARINVHGLKKLMRKALEMMAIVDRYVEDQDEDMTASLSICLDTDNVQEEVKTALKKFKSRQQKRKTVELETPAKKKKLLQSTENTLTEQDKVVRISDESTGKVKDDIENLNDTKSGYVTPVNETSKNNNQSPSFIDTFQQFVGKTMVKPVEKTVEKKTKVEPKKKQIVKTKIGQFKPSPPKKLNTSSTNLETVSPLRKSFGSVKEIEYEVKEQENDCNILILKI